MNKPFSKHLLRVVRSIIPVSVYEQYWAIEGSNDAQKLCLRLTANITGNKYCIKQVGLTFS